MPGSAAIASRHTRTGLCQTRLRRSSATTQREHAPADATLNHIGTRSTAVPPRSSSRATSGRDDHRDAGARDVDAVLGHRLAQRDDARRRRDAGEPPQRARAHSSGNARRSDERRRRRAPPSPAAASSPSGSASVVTVWALCMIDWPLGHEHQSEVAPDDDRLRQQVEQRRRGDGGVESRPATGRGTPRPAAVNERRAARTTMQQPPARGRTRPAAAASRRRADSTGRLAATSFDSSASSAQPPRPPRRRLSRART